MAETFEQAQTRLLLSWIVDGDATIAKMAAGLYGIDWDRFVEEYSKEIVIAKLTQRCYNTNDEKETKV